MRMAMKGSLGVAVALLVAGEVPDDERLVTAGAQKHIGTVALVNFRTSLSTACSLFH